MKVVCIWVEKAYKKGENKFDYSGNSQKNGKRKRVCISIKTL